MVFGGMFGRVGQCIIVLHEMFFEQRRRPNRVRFLFFNGSFTATICLKGTTNLHISPIDRSGRCHVGIIALDGPAVISTVGLVKDVEDREISFNTRGVLKTSTKTSQSRGTTRYYCRQTASSASMACDLDTKSGEVPLCVLSRELSAAHAANIELLLYTPVGYQYHGRRKNLQFRSLHSKE